MTQEFEVPKMRRPREHLAEILRLTQDSAETEMLLSKTIEVTLKDLKKLYDSAIKPLEILYKYRDLSNRHFGGALLLSVVRLLTNRYFELSSTLTNNLTHSLTIRQRHHAEIP